jgi:hypothetical protein
MLFGIPLVVVAKLGVTVAIVGSTFDVVIKDLTLSSETLSHAV